MTIARIASAILISASALMALSTTFAQSPSEREASAAAHAKRQGKLPTQGTQQYQKNVLARCEVSG